MIGDPLIYGKNRDSDYCALKDILHSSVSCSLEEIYYEGYTVYAYFTPYGDCEYIGHTKHIKRRHKQHSYWHEFAPERTVLFWDMPLDREEALELERNLIENINPKRNILIANHNENHTNG